MNADRILRVTLVGCWLLSGLTQLWEGGERLLPAADPPPDLEIPGDEPGRVLAVLETCRSLVHGNVVLGVVGPGDVTHLFLHYRLAYELYPVRVASETYAPGEQQLAMARARTHGPRFLLVLGGSEASMPGARVVARPTAVDVLLSPEAGLTAAAESR